MEKVCTKCKKLLPYERFVKCNRNKSGITSDCKECHRSQSEQWRKNNPGSMATCRKNWYANVKKEQCIGNEYYSQMRLRRLKKENDWRRNNKERTAKISKKYRTSHSEDVKQKRKKRYTENPNQVRGWYKVNQAVKKGVLPNPNSVKCIQCENTAKEYHHHNGYEEKYLLDVIPLCASCHRQIHLNETKVKAAIAVR